MRKAPPVDHHLQMAVILDHAPCRETIDVHGAALGLTMRLIYVARGSAAARVQPLDYREFGALEQMQGKLHDDALRDAAMHAFSEADAVHGRESPQTWSRRHGLFRLTPRCGNARGLDRRLVFLHPRAGTLLECPSFVRRSPLVAVMAARLPSRTH
jgi:hypothetical protein